MQYEDDHFHPNNDSDDSVYYQDEDDVTFASYEASVNTVQANNRKTQKSLYESYKKLDKGFRQIVRLHNGKKVSVELYVTSHAPGSSIRDAVTGNRYKNMKVGSLSENAFFKVRNVSGEIGRDSGNLYFETPSQCEKYLKINLSDKTKQNWHTKYDSYCDRISKLEEKTV